MRDRLPHALAVVVMLALTAACGSGSGDGTAARSTTTRPAGRGDLSAVEAVFGAKGSRCRSREVGPSDKLLAGLAAAPQSPTYGAEQLLKTALLPIVAGVDSDATYSTVFCENPSIDTHDERYLDATGAAIAYRVDGAERVAIVYVGNRSAVVDELEATGARVLVDPQRALAFGGVTGPPPSSTAAPTTQAR